MELGKLGTIRDAQGNSAYQAWRNPLLIQGVLGINPQGWGATPMNPAIFATGLAASAIAQVLGGQVVTDPQAAFLNVTARSLAVQVGDNDPVNAGYICSILGNDVAYGSARMKSWEICERFGIPFDPTLAEALYSAVTQ